MHHIVLCMAVMLTAVGEYGFFFLLTGGPNELYFEISLPS